MKSFKREKILFSIKDVSEMFNVNASLLRYWETVFDSIRPEKSAKGTRQYTQESIEAIRRVHYLVKEKGLTLSGAQQKLKETKGKGVDPEEIVQRLKTVRAELLAMKEEFDEIEKNMPG